MQAANLPKPQDALYCEPTFIVVVFAELLTIKLSEIRIAYDKPTL